MKIYHYLVLFCFLMACQTEVAKEIEPQIPDFVKACDLSFLPEIRESGIVCTNLSGQKEDMFYTLKNAGMNTVRLRLWNNPTEQYADFENVKKFSKEIQQQGVNVWLTVHYSDTWADPGAQQKPQNWKDLSFNVLQDSVYHFTTKVMTEIKPQFIQIGNEINSGFLFPEGKFENLSQMKTLLQKGIEAVRKTNPKTKIILHFAGFEAAIWFFEHFTDLDFDIIGLSYYPNWHGKDLDKLQNELNNIANKFSKQILIAETAYPFSLGWNDWTNNIFGLESQIIPTYSASPEGQKAFLFEIKNIIRNTPNGLGFAYWGGEWIAYKGKTATNGSSWENLAFWNFENQVLPAIEVFEN